MLQEISYYLIFGKPFIMYLGIAVLLSFSVTAYVGYLLHRGRTVIRNHHIAIAVSFALAIVHAVLGMLLYF